MSEFKFVQWGKGVPVDYQRLNAMMLNDQHLKDKVDPSPRGVLIWKQTGPLASVDPNGSYQSVSGFTTLGFDVEAGRLTSFYFNPGVVYADAGPCQVRFRFVIDATTTADIGGGGGTNAAGNYFNGPVFHMPNTALAQGSHTVSVQMIADSGVTNMVLGAASSVIFVVRDEGAFVSESA